MIMFSKEVMGSAQSHTCLQFYMPSDSFSNTYNDLHETAMKIAMNIQFY